MLDKDRVVRGWYNGLDSLHLIKLADDVVLLMLEKDKKEKTQVIWQLVSAVQQTAFFILIHHY